MLDGELPSPGNIPNEARVMREVSRAIDYVRHVMKDSPESTVADDFRNFLRGSALLLPPKKKV
jgi:hypothetical protein